MNKENWNFLLWGRKNAPEYSEAFSVLEGIIP